MGKKRTKKGKTDKRENLGTAKVRTKLPGVGSH